MPDRGGLRQGLHAGWPGGVVGDDGSAVAAPSTATPGSLRLLRGPGRSTPRQLPCATGSAASDGAMTGSLRVKRSSGRQYGGNSSSPSAGQVSRDASAVKACDGARLGARAPPAADYSAGSTKAGCVPLMTRAGSAAALSPPKMPFWHSLEPIWATQPPLTGAAEPLLNSYFGERSASVSGAPAHLGEADGSGAATRWQCCRRRWDPA